MLLLDGQIFCVLWQRKFRGSLPILVKGRCTWLRCWDAAARRLRGPNEFAGAAGGNADRPEDFAAIRPVRSSAAWERSRCA